MLNKKKQTEQLNRENMAEGKVPSASFRFRRFSLWNGSRPGAILLLIGLLTAFLMSVPLVYVIVRSLFAGKERWLRLLDTRIPELLWNTVSLTVMVTFCAVLIGVSLAWIVNRTDLPLRKTWTWILALPLVIPPYVGAVAYIIIFGPRGWLRTFWENSSWLSGSYPLNMYSFWGVFFVLTMFTYPYVYLIASASLRKMNRNFEEVARSQGMNARQIFWKVNLPFLRPAIGAGAILIALYVLSDFGAIAMLRYTTFTAAIYYQMGSYDNLSATVLSVVLIALTLIFLWAEGKTRRRQNYYQTTNTFNEPDILALGKWKPLATGFVLLVFFLSVLLPIIVLVYWSIIGMSEGALDTKFWKYALNSIQVSGLAAFISMLLALPIIYLKSRYPSFISSGIEKLSYSGYSLPGVIVALGIIFMFNQTPIYNTFYLVAIAFVIRFLPQAMQSGEASLSLLSPRIDEAARSLGHPPWKVMLKVIIPSILPGILAGGALVFVSSIKELPATLLLRPPGFDTLAVRIWVETSESLYHLAAPPALFIVLISIIPLRYMLKKY